MRAPSAKTDARIRKLFETLPCEPENRGTAASCDAVPLRAIVILSWWADNGRRGLAERNAPSLGVIDWNS